MATCEAIRYVQTYYFVKFYENESNALHIVRYNQNSLIKQSLSHNLIAKLIEERFLQESRSNAS